MNGKDVLHSFDLDDYNAFDKEIDTVTELNGNSIVNHRKDLFDLEADAESGQFVRHANAIRSLQQSWPQFGMNPVGSTQDAVRDSAMNKMFSVFSVRVSALRVSAFDRGSAFDRQREGRQCLL
jgi:hypothetical protein